MVFNEYIKEKNYYIYILVIALIFLAMPYFIRMIGHESMLIPGDKSYNHMAITETAFNKQTALFQIVNDPLIVPTRAQIITPYHMLLATFDKIFPLTAIIVVLSILLGLATLFLFDRILARFGFEYFERFVMCILLVLSPLFLGTYLIPDQIYFAIFLQLLGFYLYINTKKSYVKYLSLLPYTLLSFFSIIHTLIAILLISTYELILNKKYKLLVAISVIMLAICIYYNFPVYFIYGFIKAKIASGNFYIADLGSKQGFGIFTLLLLLFGIIKTWREKYNKNFSLIYLLLCLLIVLTLFYPLYMPYLNFVVVIFAGLGFLYLFKMKWEIKTIKNFTILIIILGILFSGVSFIKIASYMPPSKEFIQTLDKINQEYPNDTIILSHPDYGHIIKYYAQRKVLMDSSEDFIEDYDYYLSVTNTIFQSRSINEVSELLARYNIKLILITKEMKNGLVWERDNEGLLFLLDNSNKFKPIYYTPNIELWEFNNNP